MANISIQGNTFEPKESFVLQLTLLLFRLAAIQSHQDVSQRYE